MASNKSVFHLILPELKYLIFQKRYMAFVDITDKCNLRCKYCYHNSHLSAEDNITIGQWKERFKGYLKVGIRYIGFVGGEPSLRYDILQLAEKYFPFVETFTNGQIKIPEEFNHRILLSLQGLEEEHDEICGKGTFKRAINNYSGDRRIVVYTTISKDNYKGPGRIKELLDFIRKMNIQGIRFSPYIPQITEDNSLVLTDIQRQELGKILLEEAERKDSVLLMSIGLIKHIAYTSLPIKCSAAKKHAYKDRMYFFDNQNKIKRCASNENDCSRCLPYYDPPIYKIGELLYRKAMSFKYFYKI